MPDAPLEESRTVPDDSGKRAEEVALWYFRLNGFFSIPGFVLHSSNLPRRNITEADLLAVRFPHSREELRDIWMNDDRWVQNIAATGKTLFVIAEVKTAHCSVNGPWTDPRKAGMERVIKRFGFIDDDEEVNKAAKDMYDRLRCVTDDAVVQYVCIGSRVVQKVRGRVYPDLVQLTWDGVADFLYERFKAFGNLKGSHPQWGVFGERYANAIGGGEIHNSHHSQNAVQCYLETGRLTAGEVA